MKVLLNVVGLLMILLAVLQVLLALSALHETTAAVTWTGGWLLLGIAAVIDRLERLIEARATIA